MLKWGWSIYWLSWSSEGTTDARIFAVASCCSLMKLLCLSARSLRRLNAGVTPTSTESRNKSLLPWPRIHTPSDHFPRRTIIYYLPRARDRGIGRPLIARHRIRPRTNQTTRFRTFILIYRRRYESKRPPTTVTINSARHACHSFPAVSRLRRKYTVYQLFRRPAALIALGIFAIYSMHFSAAGGNLTFACFAQRTDITSFWLLVVRPNCIQLRAV